MLTHLQYRQQWNRQRRAEGRARRQAIQAAYVAHRQCAEAFGAVAIGQDVPAREADGTAQDGQSYQFTATNNPDALTAPDDL